MEMHRPDYVKSIEQLLKAVVYIENFKKNT
jgi:hypothetical protein